MARSGLAAAMMLAAALVPGLATAAPALDLPADAQQRLGVAVSHLAARRNAAQIDAFAKVLDPGPLAQLDSDLRAAEAAAAASKAEAERAQALNKAGGSIASKDAEAAVSQAGQDRAKVLILRERLGLEWGPGIARLSDARRLALIGELSSGKAALVHVDTPNNAGQAGARTVKIDIGDGSANGVVIGPARQAEPRLQSSGLIVEVTGPMAVLLSIGLTQSAHIDASTQQAGVLIPRGAVIRYLGSDWVYVRTAPARFERRLVANPVIEDDGFFVAHGFQPGDEVATRGAVALFAAEQGQPARAD